MENDRVSIFSVTKAIMDHRKANVICAPEPDSMIDIRLESGDIVEWIQGDDNGVPEVEGVPKGALGWR